MSTGSPPSALFLCLVALCFLSTQGARIDSISATVDRKVKHETFVPLVAFKCGYRNKFMNESGQWQDDPSSAAVCLEGKLDILKYCKRSYPDRKITNIVEYSHISHVQSWCKEAAHGCQKSFYVRPWRCIEGDFIADSLQVPSKCKFGHVSGQNDCDDYVHWNKKAESQCSQSLDDHDHKTMKLHSFAMLEPCGLSLFRGVEYVCCPRSVEEKFMVENEYSNTDEDDDEEDEEDDDDELADEEDEKAKNDEKDPYFTEDAQANEHDRYHEAQERLEKRYRIKVTKVITEWSELFERYNKMKAKDPEGAETYKSEMTARFRKTVSSLEDENKEQRRQLEEIHDERVQSALNEKKRKATHDYRMALAIQVGHVNKNNVLRTLKDYIKAEEKDRVHMLNRYRHLLRSNPDNAASFEPMLLHRLRYIDLRINGTLAMLRDFPELERQLRPIAEEYWHSYRRENTPEIDGKLMQVDENEKDSNERLVQMYKDAILKKSKTPRVQSSFNEVVKTHKSADVKAKFVPLKDILVEKKKEKVEQEEDSDEDQFEEDDDDEEQESVDNNEVIKTSPIVVNETVTAEKAAEKLAAQQRFAKEQHAHKLAREQGRELPEKQPIKAFDLSKSKQVEEKNDDAEEKDENYDDEEEDEGEQEIEIDDRLFVRKEVEPAYAKHDKLMADGVEPHEQVTSAFWSSQTSLLVYVTMVLCVLAVAAIVLRNRQSRQGFIEVDVCNPDENYHANKMQINGYENPTYFFNSKP